MKSTATAKILRTILPLLALIIGGLVTFYLLETGPEASWRAAQKNAPMVTTTTLQYSDHATIIKAMGVVSAEQSVDLKPQISGEVIALGAGFLPGASFQKGDMLLQLDKRDYELALMEQISGVEQAQSDLDLESGSQLVARRELSLLGEEVTEEEKRLILREPQLRSLQTALKVAETKKEQAELDLTRTTITAPFNSIVQSRDVNIGAWVSTSTSLATLVGTDAFWVEISVPEGQLKWITLPHDGERGSPVRIYNPVAWGETATREGEVIQLLPSLEAESRMARLLINVDDPLALRPEKGHLPQLLIDSYVRVVIEGKHIAPSLEIPREYLRNGRELWIFSEEGTLEIRPLDIAFTNQDSVLITGGVDENERIITSELTSAIQGMPVADISLESEHNSTLDRTGGKAPTSENSDGASWQKWQQKKAGASQ